MVPQEIQLVGTIIILTADNAFEALQYEIRLSELAAAARHGGPTIERTAASFEMLGKRDSSAHPTQYEHAYFPFPLLCAGELIPQLGIFQRVMKKITDELRGTYAR